VIRTATLALLALATSLVACGSQPTVQDMDAPKAHFDPAKDPYWEDPRWARQLLDAVQSVVRDPVGPEDQSAPDLHGVVRFTYADGNIQYPEVIQSTGKPDMDELMLRQVASAKAPLAEGIGSDAPHVFVLDLDMPTPYESLEYSVFDAIDRARVYPKNAILSGATGTTVVGFDYLDGKASNITRTKSSGDKDLDKASLDAVTKAALPPAPSVYAGKTLHMESSFCYSLNGPGKCPVRKGSILVYGTRIRRSGF
jgi:TonB family protein